jgi:hypothetical protein
MNPTLKNILMGIVVLALIGAGYYLFFGRTKPPAVPANNGGLTTSEGAPVSSVINTDKPLGEIEATKIGQEFINQLLSLQAIKLNDEIFASLAFQSLEDFTIVLIQSGNEGRPNPFAPFGSDNTTPGSDSISEFVPTGSDGVTEIDPNAWLVVKLGNNDIEYPPTWTVSTQYEAVTQEGKEPKAIAHLFTLPNMATISWGGTQSACSTSTYPAFQYGASTMTCIKNSTVQINGQNPTTETKAAFGDLVVKNK